MSIKKVHQQKNKERTQIARKMAAGQTLDEHIKEVSAFDLPALKRSSMLMKVNGYVVRLRPNQPAEIIAGPKKRKAKKKKTAFRKKQVTRSRKKTDKVAIQKSRRKAKRR